MDSLAKKAVIDFSHFEPKDEILERVFSARVDTLRHPERKPAIISRDGCKVFRRQGFSVVSGLEGSRKTWFCLSISTAFFSEYLGFESGIDNGVLLWIDTEQSDEDIFDLIDRFFKITKLPKNTDRVIFLALREFNPV